MFCASTRTDVRQILRDDLTFVLSFMLSVFLLPPSLLLLLSLPVSPLHTRERLSSHCIYNPVAPSRLLASLWLAGWCGWASSICNTSRSLYFSHQEMDQSQPKESEHALMGRLYIRSQICRLAHTCIHKLQWDAFINASVCRLQLTGFHQQSWRIQETVRPNGYFLLWSSNIQHTTDHNTSQTYKPCINGVGTLACSTLHQALKTDSIAVVFTYELWLLVHMSCPF